MGNCGISSSISKDNSAYREDNTNVEMHDDKDIISRSNAAGLHQGAILGLTCLKDGKISTCSDDKTIVIYDWKAETRQTLTGHTKAVNRVVGSRKDTSFIFSVSRDLSVKQWRQDSGECVQTLSDAHTLTIPGIALSPDESLICTGSRDYSVKVWDIETGKVISSFSSPRNIVTAIAWGSDCNNGAQNIVYQGSEDLCIRGWDTRQSSKVPAVHLTGFVYFPTSLVLSSSSSHLAAGCKGFNKNGCEIKIWDLRGGKSDNTNSRSGNSPMKIQDLLGGHEHDVTGVRFVNGDESLMSVSRDGTLRSWKYLDSIMSSQRFILSDRTSFSCLDSWQNRTDSGGDLLAVGDVGGSVYVCDHEGVVVHSTEGRIREE